MTHAEHPAVHTNQRTAGQTAADLLGRHTRGGELSARYEAVLRGGDAGDPAFWLHASH
ncbi:MAG: hypothetical protein WKF96_19525 [Solirubrobacteraceae bacterium]